LKLESLQKGDQLTVLLDEGEPIRNVPQSVINEGHQVIQQIRVGHYYQVVIQKEV
jgi:tRNA 2-thiouridine synthesizing protein A